MFRKFILLVCKLLESVDDQITSHRHGLNSRGFSYRLGSKWTDGGQTIIVQPAGIVYPANHSHLLVGTVSYNGGKEEQWKPIIYLLYFYSHEKMPNPSSYQREFFFLFFLERNHGSKTRKVRQMIFKKMPNDRLKYTFYINFLDNFAQNPRGNICKSNRFIDNLQ